MASQDAFELISATLTDYDLKGLAGKPNGILDVIALAGFMASRIDDQFELTPKFGEPAGSGSRPYKQILDIVVEKLKPMLEPEASETFEAVAYGQDTTLADLIAVSIEFALVSNFTISPRASPEPDQYSPWRQ